MKIPEQNSLDSMEGVPRQDIPFSEFDQSEKQELSVENRAQSSIDLSHLAKWIREYDRTFGPWARLGRAMGSYMGGAESEEELSVKEREELAARQAQSEIIARNSKEAGKVGLQLEFPADEENKEWALSLRVNIADKNKFISYLQSLQEPTESQIEGLNSIAEVLILQLKDGYNLDDPEDDRLIEFAGSFRQIISEFERLSEKNPGLVESKGKLKEIYSAFKDGFLKEFIKLSKTSLLDSPAQNTFGPGKWHTDASEDWYIKKWTGALQTLDEIGRNPKAQRLAGQLRENLLMCAKYAETDMKEKKNHLYNNKISTFMEMLKNQLRAK